MRLKKDTPFLVSFFEKSWARTGRTGRTEGVSFLYHSYPLFMAAKHNPFNVNGTPSQ